MHIPLSMHLRISKADLGFARASKTEEDETSLDLLTRRLSMFEGRFKARADFFVPSEDRAEEV